MDCGRYRRGWLAAVAAIGLGAPLVSFAPARAADVDPATMSADAIKALEQRLTDAGCYKGAIEGHTSDSARRRQSRPAPTSELFLRIETGMHTAVINSIGIDADCSLIATASDDKTVRLWSLPDGKTEARSCACRSATATRQGLCDGAVAGRTSPGRWRMGRGMAQDGETQPHASRPGERRDVALRRV